MSGSHTPESALSTSSSSRSSGRRLDSNTTPSPSGGHRSPKFNPRALSNRLAMLEASQALAQASATLSIAAQAMSKAATSLAAIGDYGDDDCSHEVGDFGGVDDWDESPDWTRSNYNLAPRPDTSSADNERYAFNEGYNLTKVTESAPVEEPLEPLQQEHLGAPEPDVDVHASWSAPSFPSVSQSFTTQAPPEVLFGQRTFNTSNNPVSSTVDPIPVAVKSETGLPLNRNETKGSEPGARDNKPTSKVPVPIPVTTKEIPQASAKDSWGFSGWDTPSSQAIGPTHIILERGFDSLPTLCYLAERCAKTICIYNYPGTVLTTMHIEAMLKKNTKLPVIMPESAKLDRMAAATKKFNLAPSSILVWPGSKKLPKITGLADSADIQVVHIGEPNPINAGIVCLNTTLILAKSNLGQSQGNYLLDPLNDICNQQGSGSLLEPYRIWLRSRFSQNACARGIYWDWIVQRRKQDPKRGVVEVVRLANRFAEEFLLRGTSKKYGNPVGGRVTVTEALLKGHSMEPAVKAGLLLVS